MEQLLTVDQAAAVFGTTTRFPRRLIAERRIRFVRVGGTSASLRLRWPSSSRPGRCSRSRWVERHESATVRKHSASGVG
jgi:excisionase family DNA binding protein